MHPVYWTPHQKGVSVVPSQPRVVDAGWLWCPHDPRLLFLIPGGPKGWDCVYPQLSRSRCHHQLWMALDRSQQKQTGGHRQGRKVHLKSRSWEVMPTQTSVVSVEMNCYLTDVPIDWWFQERQKKEYQDWRLGHLKDGDTVNKRRRNWFGDKGDEFSLHTWPVQVASGISWWSFQGDRNEELKPISEFGA